MGEGGGGGGGGGGGSNGELVLARHTWAQGMSWERRDDVTSWETESSRGQLVSFVEASRGQCMSLGSRGTTCVLVNLSLANTSIGKSIWEPQRKLNKFTMSRAREAFAFTPRLCFSLYLVTVVEHVSSHSSMYPKACTNATDRASWRSVNVATFDSSTIVSSDEEFVLWDNIQAISPLMSCSKGHRLALMTGVFRGVTSLRRKARNSVISPAIFVRGINGLISVTGMQSARPSCRGSRPGSGNPCAAGRVIQGVFIDCL